VALFAIKGDAMEKAVAWIASEQDEHRVKTE